MEEFSTRDIEPSRRLAEWNNRISERLTAVDIDARHDFVGTMRTCELGSATIASISGDTTTLRTSSDGVRRSRSTSLMGVAIQDFRTARYRIGAKEQFVHENEFVLLDLTSPYQSETGDDGKTVTALYVPTGDILARRPNAMDRIGCKGSVLTGPGALLRSFAHTCLTHPMSENKAALGAVLTDLISLLLESLGEDPLQIVTRNRVREEAITLIDNFLCDPDLNTTFIADRLGVSPRYVQMLFADISQSPSAFIRTRRLDKAREAVMHPDRRKISDIAFDLGFGDLSQFNRSFKLRFGTAPSRLRRSLN